MKLEGWVKSFIPLVLGIIFFTVTLAIIILPFCGGGLRGFVYFPGSSHPVPPPEPWYCIIFGDFISLTRLLSNALLIYSFILVLLGIMTPFWELASRIFHFKGPSGIRLRWFFLIPLIVFLSVYIVAFFINILNIA